MKRPRGWPKTRSQDSARARAMIDDEVLRRFYWGCSAACRDNQYEWDPWHLWALSPLRSHFYYYLFTYSNNVGVISAAINLQPWLVNSELCNKKKEGMSANHHYYAEDIYSLPLLPGTVLHQWREENIWKYVNTHLDCSSSLLVLLIS